MPSLQRSTADYLADSEATNELGVRLVKDVATRQEVCTIRSPRARRAAAQAGLTRQQAGSMRTWDSRSAQPAAVRFDGALVRQGR